MRNLEKNHFRSLMHVESHFFIGIPFSEFRLLLELEQTPSFTRLRRRLGTILLENVNQLKIGSLENATINDSM